MYIIDYIYLTLSGITVVKTKFIKEYSRVGSSGFGLHFMDPEHALGEQEPLDPPQHIFPCDGSDCDWLHPQQLS